MPAPKGTTERSLAVIAEQIGDLTETEIEPLNRVTVAYLEFAELQASNRVPMHMADWIAKLDEFLRLAGSGVLAGAGRISHAAAMAKVDAEFPRWDQRRIEAPSAVEAHFAASLASAIGETKAIAAAKKAKASARKGKPHAS